MLSLDHLTESIYLYDSALGLYHDIKNTPYTLTLPEGTVNNRFQIPFTDQALSDTVIDSQKFELYQNNANQMLTLQNPFQMELSEVGLYDSLGKTIFAKKNCGNNPIYEFSTLGLAEGIYIVRIRTTEGYSLSKKIIIKTIR